MKIRRGLWFVPVIIFATALFIRVLYVANFNRLLSADALGYDRLAIALNEGKGYVNSEGKPTSWWPPLYPFFLSVIYRLGGHNYFLVRLVQALIWSLTCIIIYFIGKSIFDYKIGIITAGMSVLYFGFIRCAALFLSETLFTFFIAVAILCLIRNKEKFSLLSLILTGIILGVASLTKAIILLFPIFILALFLTNRVFSFKKSILYFAIISTAMILVIMPWTIRNYKVHHAFVPIANQGGITFYFSYRPPEGKIFGKAIEDEITLRADKIESETEKSQFFYREAFKFIRHHLQEVLRLSIFKIAYFLSPFDWEIIGEDGTYNFQYVFFAVFAAVGTFFAFKQKIKSINYLILPIVYFLFFSIITQGCPRHRLIAEPYLIILSAFGLFSFYKKVKNIYLANSITLFIFFSNYLIYLNGASFKLWARGIFQQLGLW